MPALAVGMSLLLTNAAPANPINCAEALQLGYDIPADLNKDCYVNYLDYQLLHANWQRCIVPNTPGCDTPWIPFKDVTEFGAAGDDQADDTAAFVAALVGGGNVYVPPGTYLVTGLQIPADTFFYGAGPASSYIEVTDPAGQIDVGSNCQVEDLHFTGLPDYEAGGGANGLIYISAFYVSLNNIAVEDYKHAGVQVHGGHHVEITNSHFEKLAWGINIESVKNVNVTGNRLIDIGGHGIQFFGNFNFQDVLCEDLVFKDNHITNATGGAYIWGTGGRRVLMLNNIGDGLAGDVGFDLEWCFDSAIIGNVAKDARNAGISLFLSCKNVEIRENTVFVGTGAPGWPVWGDLRVGIWLTPTNTGIYPGDMGHENIEITGNTIYNEDETGRHAIAVGSTGPAGNVTTSANTIINGDIFPYDTGSITQGVDTLGTAELFVVSPGFLALGVPFQYVWTHLPIGPEPLLPLTNRYQPSTNTILIKDAAQQNEAVLAIRHNIQVFATSGTAYVSAVNYDQTEIAYSNGDFETGTYSNWTVTGTAWGAAPVSSHAGVSGQGTFWADSIAGGNSATGSLRSANFTLQGNRLRFQQAGWPGQDDWGIDALWYSSPWKGNRCVLKRTTDDALLFVLSPPYSLNFRQDAWNTGAYAGQQVYFEAEDGNSGSSQAWFALDEFHQATVDRVSLTASADAGGATANLVFGDDPDNLRIVQGQDYTLSVDGSPVQTKTAVLSGPDIEVTFNGIAIPGTDTTPEVTIAVAPAP